MSAVDKAEKLNGVDLHRNKINGLDLFSGIGGISRSLGEWVNTIAYCERDQYASSVLLSRISEGLLDWAPIWDDVTTLCKNQFPEGYIDIIFGGFPCQDISAAGDGAGLAGKRSGLFFEIIRLAKELCPAFVFLENVPAIRTRGLREVIRAFTDIGYDCRWTCVSAAEVGAPHLRKRWFLLAHTNGKGVRNELRWRSRESWESKKFTEYNGSTQSLANTDGIGLQSRLGAWGSTSVFASTSNESWWEVEPAVGRVVDGVPHRVDRIKCLGNAVVPVQVKTAFKKLLIGVK